MSQVEKESLQKAKAEGAVKTEAVATGPKPKGKKNKAPSAKSVPHRDIYARLSYLYQTAHHLSQSSDLEPVGRMYAHTMKSIAKKNVLRM